MKSHLEEGQLEACQLEWETGAVDLTNRASPAPPPDVSASFCWDQVGRTNCSLQERFAAAKTDLRSQKELDASYNLIAAGKVCCWPDEAAAAARLPSHPSLACLPVTI